MSKKSKLQLRLEAERAKKENLDGILKYHKSFSSKPERILKQIKKPNLPWRYVANTLVIVKYSALVHLIANYTVFPEIRKIDKRYFEKEGILYVRLSRTCQCLACHSRQQRLVPTSYRGMEAPKS